MKYKYYIAYGSNLSTEQMKVRTPGAVIVGTGRLEGWRLLFRQFATIEKAEGYSVPVLVWKISAQNERSLDRYEGYPKFYTKQELMIDVTSLDGEALGEIPAMVYVMTPAAVNVRGVSLLPSDYYLGVLTEGYEAFGFDVGILGDALAEAARKGYNPNLAVS